MSDSRKKTSSKSPGSEGRVGVPEDAVFTIDELVVYLKLPKSTVYKLAQQGAIPGHKVGRHWRFHRATIDAWLSTRKPKKEQP